MNYNQTNKTHVFYTFDALELKKKKKKKRERDVLARNRTVNIAVISEATQ